MAEQLLENWGQGVNQENLIPIRNSIVNKAISTFMLSKTYIKLNIALNLNIMDSTIVNPWTNTSIVRQVGRVSE